MKKLLSLPLIFFSVVAFSQDIIYTTGNDRIEAKIEEVGEHKIKYKIHSDPSGPTYVIAKKKVVIVTYENGRHENYNTPGIDSVAFHSNIVSLNYIDMLYARVNVSYERLFKDGTLGLKALGAYSFREEANYYDYRAPKYFGGLDFYHYPFGQKEFTYMVGLSSRAGETLGSGEYTDYYYGRYTPQPPKFFLGFYMSHGAILHISEHVSLSGFLGLGFRGYEATGDVDSHVIGELNASIRF